MALRKKLWESSDFNGKFVYSFSRYYGSNKVDFKEAKDYPMLAMIPVAQEVMECRRLVMQGVSTLLKMVPVLACKLLVASNVVARIKFEWIVGGLKDVLVPVEAFHLKHMFQDVIKHHQSECVGVNGAESLLPDELVLVASETLRAWEILRNGMEKLLKVYPAKARLHGVFKYESEQGIHFWRRANVDDLVPSKSVWRWRPQDPQVPSNEGKGFYGHAPAIIKLCTQAGVIAPPKVSLHDETAGCKYHTWRSKKLPRIVRSQMCVELLIVVTFDLKWENELHRSPRKTMNDYEVRDGWQYQLSTYCPPSLHEKGEQICSFALAMDIEQECIVERVKARKE
ncbi:unnamed protein product [Malus baccata var. baccata]